MFLSLLGVILRFQQCLQVVELSCLGILSRSFRIIPHFGWLRQCVDLERSWWREESLDLAWSLVFEGVLGFAFWASQVPFGGNPLVSALMSAADECTHSSFLIQPVQGGLSHLSAPPLNSHGPYRLLGVSWSPSHLQSRPRTRPVPLPAGSSFPTGGNFVFQGYWQGPFGDIFGCLSFSGETCATSIWIYNTPHNARRAATTKNSWAPHISSAKIGKNLIYPRLETYSAADFHLS